MSNEKRSIAPPPETVVVASWRQAIDAEKQARAREIVLRDEHAAEVARLKQAMRDIKKVYATEIEQLRSEHRADSRRLVEALWQTQNMARDALDGFGAQQKSAVTESKTRSWLDRIGAFEWWACLAKRG